MAWRSGRSITRSLLSAARAPPPPSIRSSPPLPRRLRPPSSSPRRPSFYPSRSFGELGCMQSLLPLHNLVAKGNLTSRLNANLRAFSELSHGTFRRSCQDR